jgi:ribosomal protein S1
MATLIAIMNVGGPRSLLYSDPEWDEETCRIVKNTHAVLAKGCVDELEFALKVYAAWSEAQYSGQLLAPLWALRKTWHSRRMPALTTEMKERLGTHTARFSRRVVEVFDYESIEQIAYDYRLLDAAEEWLKAVKCALREAQQEAWATAFFVHHGLLKYKVEPARQKLLAALEVHKKELEVRPINFEVLNKVRILLAYSGVSPSPSYPSMFSSLMKLQPEWEEWLQGHQHNTMELTRFIIQQVPRADSEEQTIPFTYQRLFLDQRAPIGSRYACRVIESTPGKPIQLELLPRSPATRLRQESVTSETEARTGAFARTRADEVRREEVDAQLATALRPNMLWGYLYATPTAYQVGNTLNVEVVGYNFDNPLLPRVVVQPVPDDTAFATFTEHYQLGDLVTVVVRAYHKHPYDSRTSLVVQEKVSQLEMLLEPEHLSFTPLGHAITLIPLGTSLEMVVDDIDEGQKKIALSLLSFMEVNLNKLLQGRKQGDGTYHIEATVTDVQEESLHLLLQGSDPTRGLIYAVQIPAHALTEPLNTYAAGHSIPLRLTFCDTSSAEDIQGLPSEVKKVIDLQQAFQFLFWEPPLLHFHGRMFYKTRNKLLALSTDRTYQQAIRQLYLLSHQFTAEVVPIKTPTQTTEALYDARINAEYPAQDTTYPQELPLIEEPYSEEQTEEDTVLRREIPRTPPQVNTSVPSYQPGDRAKGWVTGVLDYGAFVEFPSGLKGLVHKSKVWGYVADARDIIHVGQELEAIILGVKPDGNLELSLRLPEEDPLLQYQVDDKVTGVVLNIQEHGALIEIEPDVRGFVHKSKMWGYVAHVEDVVQHSETVTVRILSIDLEKRRLELSMQVPEHDRLLDYKAGEIVQGIVTEVVDYGAFVEIEPGVSGLVYKDDMPRLVTDVRRFLSKGDEVEVLIVRIDWAKRHLSLSMKDL